MAKKTIKHYTIIPINIYKNAIILVLGNKGIEDVKNSFISTKEKITREYEDYLEEAKNLKRETVLGECVFIKMIETDITKSHHIFIPGQSFDFTNKLISAVSHECLHVTMKILNSLGVRYEDDDECSNEAFTYLHEYLFTQCLDFINDLEN